MQTGSITNALIRCTREDKTPLESFELVCTDLGLWVRELDYTSGAGIPDQVASILSQLQSTETELRRLSGCTTDYTLFIEFDLPIPIKIPVALSRLASDCNFDVEIYFTQNQGGEQGADAELGILTN